MRSALEWFFFVGSNIVLWFKILGSLLGLAIVLKSCFTLNRLGTQILNRRLT